MSIAMILIVKSSPEPSAYEPTCSTFRSDAAIPHPRSHTAIVGVQICTQTTPMSDVGGGGLAQSLGGWLCEKDAHTARTAQAFLATLCIFQVFFRVARTRWPKGYAYNNGGLHSSLLTKGGCSCPHPLPGEGRRKRKKKM